jgi:hypothetical protein
MAKSPEEMTASMIANLPDKTGRSLDQWLAITKKAGLARHGEIVKMLKADHGMGHGYANLVAHETLKASSGGGVEPAGEDLVAAQYAGDKAALKPIYDALVKAIRGFGGDVDFAPKKAYVSLRRAKQFGLIQPSTKSRVDVGINLKGVEPTARLEASGSFNAMVSHRVKLGSAAEVDKELIDWLRRAYESS